MKKNFKKALICFMIMFALIATTTSFSSTTEVQAASKYKVTKSSWTRVAIPASKGKNVRINSISGGPLDVKMTNRSGSTVWQENCSMAGSTIYATCLARSYWCGTDVYYVYVRLNSRCPYSSLYVEASVY